MRRMIVLAAVFLVVAAAFYAGYRFRSPEAQITGVPATASQTSAAADGSRAAAPVDSSPQAPGTVQVSPEKQQLMGIRLATAERAPQTHTLRVLGRVAAGCP